MKALTKFLIAATFFLAALVLVWLFPSKAFAADCSRPFSGSFIVSSGTSCNFPGASDGVDGISGLGTTVTDPTTATTNNADIKVCGSTIDADCTSTTPASLLVGTVGLDQTIAWGGTITISTGGSITMRNGSKLQQGPIWMPTDGGSSSTCSETGGCYYPATSTFYIGSTQPTSGACGGYTCYRRAFYYDGTTAGTTATTDCNSNTYIWRTLNVAKDAENDGYSLTTTTGSQCVGDGPSVINGRNYFKDSANQYTWWDAASSTTDCNEAVAGTCANAISNLSSAVASQTQINLSWSAPTVPSGSGAITGYKVYNCSGSSCTPTTLVASGVGTTSYSNTGLTCGTIYRHKVLATNSAGDSADSNITGNTTTSSCVSAPTVTSPTATSITATSATLGANVTSNGGAALTARGTCWGTSASPTTNCAAEGGTATGVFSHSRTGLTANTFYYYRGYATNSVGTSYSADGTFTTIAAPTVTSPTATSIGATSATLGANVTSNGGAALTARGTCWGTSASPTTNCAAEGGTATGVFSHSRTGLTASTFYYYRGYATNSVGTSYSADGTFTTAASAPTVTTNAATSVGNASATLNSSVNPNGAATTGWHRYGTSNPGCASLTTATSSVALGSGTTAVSNPQGISTLSGNTTYYFCAVAQNAGGTTYGSVVSFLTVPNAPTSLTATAASSSQINLAWTAPTGGAASYNIFRCQGTGCTPNVTIATGVTTTTYNNNTGLSASTLYRYQVNAVNATSNGAGSNIAEATTQAACSANGTTCSVAGDCCSGNCYVDADGDTYAPATGTKTCKAAAATAGTDCYDSNANAKPGQTSWFTTDRGDTSFDYNCSGSTEVQYPYSKGSSCPGLAQMYNATCTVAEGTNTVWSSTYSIGWNMCGLNYVGQYFSTGTIYRGGEKGYWDGYGCFLTVGFSSSCTLMTQIIACH